ncbi:hypothetical protein M0802_014828 [Mischocyttarus mexicanus]|nr:hypothetical protein M0802_014828 [Mischocyttarus mexicanus]
MISDNIGVTTESLYLRKDNIVLFTDVKGSPIKGNINLIEKLPQVKNINDLTLARARVFNQKNYKPILLPIKENIANCTKKEILYEAIGSLLSVTRELNLKSVSISRIDCLDGILWSQIQKKLCNTFQSENCKIFLCLNQITTPSLENPAAEEKLLPGASPRSGWVDTRCTWMTLG